MSEPTFVMLNSNADGLITNVMKARYKCDEGSLQMK